MSELPTIVMLRAWNAGKTDEDAWNVLAEVAATEMTNRLVESLGIPGPQVSVDAEEVVLTLDMSREDTKIGEPNFGELESPGILIRQDNKQFVVLRSDFFSALRD
jgi:hypothetical protein